MNSLDVAVLWSACAGFLVYALSHVCFLRFIKEGQIIRFLMMAFFLGTAIVVCVFYSLNMPVGLLAFFFCVLVAFFLYSVTCFLYVVGIIGPYESSIRIRLIRELFSVFPEGLSLPEILKRYNAEMILKGRLERFVGSGEVIFDGLSYRAGKDRYAFIILESAGRYLKKVTAHQKNILK